MDIIDRLAAVVGSEIEFVPDKCLHTTNRAATCERCVTLCPTDALAFGPPVTHNPDRCVRCGVCLQACPTGAFRGDDGRTNLLAHAAELGAREEACRLELVCNYHPSAEVGPGEASGVLRLSGCLGLLSASALVAMAALGAETITLRLDRCQNCPFGRARYGIEEAMQIARRLLDALGAPGEIAVVMDAAEAGHWVERSVHDAGGPVFSRRPVRGSTTEIPQAASQTLAADDLAARLEMPRERLRLLLALARLPHAHDELPAGLGFARFEAGSDCTACGLCARVCPTGALQLLEEDDAYRLTFLPGACTDCGACLPYCKPEALQAAGTPVLGEVLNAEPVVLISGALRVCKKCGTRYAGPGEGNLCPVCEFRRKHPFGAYMPAAGGRPPHN